MSETDETRSIGESRAIGEAFDAAVDYYDDWMRKALPGFDDQFATAVDLVPYPRNSAIDVLDLGAGTGLFSRHVLDAFPNARFTLVDLGVRMLDVARARFAGDSSERFSFEVADYRTFEPGKDFDLVISSLSIHHLEQPEKLALFRRIHRFLMPGGAFVNIDQVRGETEALRTLYWDHWLNGVRQRGASERQIAEGIERRTTYDRDASLAEQLEWLREAGFVDVDAVYKNWFIAVFYARKA